MPWEHPGGNSANSFPRSRSLSFRPETTTLRLGVNDRASQKIGTVDVPLVVERQIAKK